MFVFKSGWVGMKGGVTESPGEFCIIGFWVPGMRAMEVPESKWASVGAAGRWAKPTSERSLAFSPDSHPPSWVTLGLRGHWNWQNYPVVESWRPSGGCAAGRAAPQVLATGCKGWASHKSILVVCFHNLESFFQEANIFEGNYRKLVEFSNVRQYWGKVKHFWERVLGNLCNASPKILY